MSHKMQIDSIRKKYRINELNAKISKIYSFAPLVTKQVIPYDKEINHNG